MMASGGGGVLQECDCFPKIKISDVEKVCRDNLRLELGECIREPWSERLDYVRLSYVTKFNENHNEFVYFHHWCNRKKKNVNLVFRSPEFDDYRKDREGLGLSIGEPDAEPVQPF